jgi:two-component system sensor histidine kinase RegB
MIATPFENRVLSMSSSPDGQLVPEAGQQPRDARAAPPGEVAARTALPWLIRLRWLALIAFLALPFGSSTGVRGGTGLAIFAGLIAAMGVTNAALWQVTRASGVRRELVGAVLVLDTGLLTGLLFVSGGAVNPGTVVYLVHITLAAVLLGSRWAWTLTALSVAAFGVLFLGSAPSAGQHVHGQAEQAFDTHLAGMWVAFAATAALIAHFVSHVASALAARERELADARAQAARHERLAALMTLAAGAAHELATPLATIAVTGREIARSAATQGCPRGEACAADAALIVSEVARCHRVLDDLSGRARGRASDARPLSLPAALEAARAALPPTDALRVDVVSTMTTTVDGLPQDEIVGVLVGLLRNALHASPQDGRVTIGADQADGNLTLRVADRGVGMSPEVLAHADEPFFTTKPPGQGLGLGVFLARSVTEQLGGRFTIRSAAGAGTEVTLTFTAGR